MSRPLILMVDRDARTAQIRANVLEISGYAVRVVDGPETAVQTLEVERPNLLLYNVGGARDLEGLRRLRRRAVRLPIVALVDSPSGDRPAELADSFVTKVDGPRALLEHLDALVRYRHHVHPELEGDCVVFVDQDRRYVEASVKACELIGYERTELIGKRIDDVSAPDSDSVQRQFDQYVKDKEQEGVFVLKHKNGRTVPIRYLALVLPDGCMAAKWEPIETA
jgi:PAS domain S-box-containing protein